VVLQQALADLNAAYRNFFASVAGRRKGPKAGRPRFRSRKDRRQAIRFTANARFKVLTSGKLRLPKIGDVPARWSRPLPPQPSWVTVIKPKLRPVRLAISCLSCCFAGLAGWLCGYFKLSGMAVARRLKASRWVLVGSVSIGTVTWAPANRTWLRVRVARWSSSPRKL
jgi:hypothetical protein